MYDKQIDHRSYSIVKILSFYGMELSISFLTGWIACQVFGDIKPCVIIAVLLAASPTMRVLKKLEEVKRHRGYRAMNI